MKSEFTKGIYFIFTNINSHFSGYDCNLIFEKLVIVAIQKRLKLDYNVVIASLSEKYVSVKIGCLKFLDSYRFLDASLDKLSTTLKFFPFLDEDGMEADLFNRKPTHPYDIVKPSNQSANH